MPGLSWVEYSKMTHPIAGKVWVVDVWAHNQEAEQARIREFPIVAVATSHDVPVPAPGGTLDGRYEAVRASVERVRSAQVGVALASRDGVLARGRVWLFHLGEELGDPRRLSKALWEWCATPDGVLVTRDGAGDVAYLVKHLKGGVLPARREEFLRVCNVAFPALYDLRVLAEYTTVGGEEPPLAAFACFVALVRDCRRLPMPVGYNAFLFGLGAADTFELVSIKKSMAEHDESMRQMEELFAQLCPGQDPECLDWLCR